jgi:hypothetical protein
MLIGVMLVNIDIEDAVFIVTLPIPSRNNWGTLYMANAVVTTKPRARETRARDAVITNKPLGREITPNHPKDPYNHIRYRHYSE